MISGTLAIPPPGIRDIAPAPILNYPIPILAQVCPSVKSKPSLLISAVRPVIPPAMPAAVD